MGKILNREHENTVAELVLDALEESGYDYPDEAIPGLAAAIRKLADTGDRTTNEQILDEAASLLAD